jgi:toxin FitB
MIYLLDTCVLSEFTRRKPDEKVIRWIDSIDEEKLAVCAITIGEIQRGIERLADSHRKTELRTWMNGGLVERFGARILPLSAQTLLTWGALCARLEQAGSTISVMDGLIAACALEHNLVLATRNVSDFQPSGVQWINPWE